MRTCVRVCEGGSAHMQNIVHVYMYVWVHSLVQLKEIHGYCRMQALILGIRMRSGQVYIHVYAFLTRPAQLCTRMSINVIPDRDRHVHTYVRTS